MVKVSAVIPAYNCELYVREAIGSVLEQTYKDMELIVVDDGSTDKTSEILRRFGSRVNCVRHTSNKGPSAARNTGIRHAKGEYIAFLDADDTWLQTKIEKQVKLFEDNKDVALVYSDCYNIDFSGLRMGKFFDTVKPHKDFVFRELLIDNFVPTSSVVVKKRILDEVGGFDERFFISQDFDLYLKIAERNKVDFVNIPLVGHRIYSQSISSRGRDILLDEVTAISRFYREKIVCHDLQLAKKLDKRIAKYMFYKAIWLLENTNKKEAINQYISCIKRGSFDYKIALGVIFFIIPRAIAVTLTKSLIKIQNR